MSDSEWVKLSKPVVLDHAGFYVTDMFDDVLIAYDVEDLLNFRGYRTHDGDEDILRKMYPLYVDFSRGIYHNDKYNDLYTWMEFEINREEEPDKFVRAVRVTDV